MLSTERIYRTNVDKPYELNHPIFQFIWWFWLFAIPYG